MRNRSPDTLRIEAIASGRSAGEARVEALVDGTPLWFASPDVEFRAASEGFLGAMLLPAMTAGRHLNAVDPVCPVWLENVHRASDACRRFWPLHALHIDVPRRMAVAPPPAQAASLAQASPPAQASPLAQAAPPARTALAFSGGVDSFYSLLRYPEPIEALVYIEDYDMPSNGRSWPGRFDSWLRSIGRAMGIRTILVRTNLKRHPTFRGTSWYAAHGACIAAVGHLLADHFDTLVLSSSVSPDSTEACGTHWSLDPLWSSQRLRVTSFGELRRPEKLLDIAAEPIAQRFLRCCWEHLNGRMNCGECEKCLRTQLILAGAGQLEAFPVFAHSDPLVQRVERLRCVRSGELFHTYERVLETNLPPALRAAVQDLLKRSRRLARWRGWRMELARQWRGFTQSLPLPAGQRWRAAG